VQDLIKSYTHLHYQILDDNSQPRLPITDPVSHLQELLLSKKTAEPESYREHDGLEVQEISFEDIKPRHGSYFPVDPDTIENDHTEAIYCGMPVWVE
jgi:hypothetical protein